MAAGCRPGAPAAAARALPAPIRLHAQSIAVAEYLKFTVVKRRTLRKAKYRIICNSVCRRAKDAIRLADQCGHRAGGGGSSRRRQDGGRRRRHLAECRLQWCVKHLL